MIEALTPRKLTIIVVVLVTVCTTIAIIEEWFLDNRDFFRTLALFGLFGGLSGLATKYKQYKADTRVSSRIRKESSRSSSPNEPDSDSDQHALIDMNQSYG